MHRIRLRWWAFRQFLYSFRLLAAAAVDSLRHLAAEKKRRHPRYALGDLGGTFREDIRQTFVRGHLNQVPFVFSGDGHPELLAMNGIAADHVVRIALKELERIEKGRVEKTGVLGGYAAAQRAHLERCDACKRFVCGVIVGDAVETKWRRDFFRRARFEKPSGPDR